ncbi:MAG: antitoxin VapB family protein [Candidatus Heimdallarchaeota archaeon]|nr:MAG: antitoxin VapB family protein [Candidatus Heimdallarchaeota archaeon]
MTYKTISLNSKAYQLLKKEKKDGESFSDTIIRLTTKPNIEKFLEMFGVLKNDLDDQELSEFKKEAHQAWN